MKMKNTFGTFLVTLLLFSVLSTLVSASHGPDLVISEATFVAYVDDTGYQLRLTIANKGSFTNPGNDVTKPFDVKIESSQTGSMVIQTLQISSVSAGGFVSVDAFITQDLKIDENVNVKVTADSGSVISEKDENNNVFQTSLVLPAKPGDADKDGVADAVDNCPAVANVDQKDTDNDGVGDVCDNPLFPTSVDLTVQSVDITSFTATGIVTKTVVKNNGDIDINGAFNLNVATVTKSGAVVSKDVTILGLKKGQILAVDVSLGMDTQSMQKIVVRTAIDSGNVISETNEKNNLLEKEFQFTDQDNDSVADAVDNCPAVANVDQKDTDNDGKGDVCDNDVPPGQNVAPVLAAIGNKEVVQGSALSFKISAADTNGDVLTFSAKDVPQGATFTPADQTFNWTPADTVQGTFNVTFTVSDGKSGEDSETIQITVKQKQSVSLFETQYNDLQKKYNEYYDDYKDLKDDYEDAVNDNDASDIKKFKNKLENLQDNVDDLEDDVDDLIDDVEDSSDSKKKQLLDNLDELLDDVQNLQDKIDTVLGKKKTDYTGVSGSAGFVPAALPALPPKTKDAAVEVQTLNFAPGTSSTQAIPQTTEMLDWTETRYILLLVGGIVVLFAFVVFLLALLLRRK